MSDDDLKPWQKVKLPTDEQVERAARAICAANGVDPAEKHIEEAQWNDTDELTHSFEETWLEHFTPQARAALAVILNQDLILGLDRP